MNRTQVNAAAGGAQQYIVVTAVPSGSPASHFEALLAAFLKDQTLTQAGVYVADIDIRGLRRCQVHVKASAVTGVVTLGVYTTYKDGTTQKTVSTPAGGALVAGVRQSLIFAEGDLAGEQILRLTLTLAGGASATLDQAEINGI